MSGFASSEFAPSEPELREAVRALTGSATARVLSWQRSPVDWRVVSEVTGGLHRLSGTLEDGGTLQPWSLVVKVNRRPPGDGKTDEAAWRREELSYTSGILRPRGGFAMARCLAVTRLSAEETWLWLEDVRDEGGALWSLNRHTAAARHLGLLNGTHRVVPGRALDWLFGGWLEQLTPLGNDEASAGLRRPEVEVWDHPLVFPEPVLAQLERLSEAAPHLHRELSAVPHALCHLDPGQFNLCSRTRADGTRETVFLDWQTLSLGALGADLAMMNALNLCRLYVRSEEAESYSDATLAAYLGGLREAGLNASLAEVCRAYTVLAALRAGAIIRVLVHALVADEAKQTWPSAWGTRLGLGRNEALQAWGRNMRFLLFLHEPPQHRKG